MFTLILDPSNEYLDLPSMTFNTKPTNADVFINNMYQGKSPVTIAMVPDTFSYRIEKRGYVPSSGSRYFAEETLSTQVRLRSKRRLFGELTSDLILPDNQNAGFTVGLVGQTGVYFSTIFPINEPTADVTIYSKYNGLNFSDFYLVPSDLEELRITHSLWILGLTQTIYKKLVVSIGYAHGHSSLFQSFTAVPYNGNQGRYAV